MKLHVFRAFVRIDSRVIDVGGFLALPYSFLQIFIVPDGFPRVLRVSTETCAVECGCVCDGVLL